VRLSVVRNIASDCTEEEVMTVLNPILNCVHTSNNSLQRRRVQISVVTSIESDCSLHDDITQLTPILNNVHT
jgi:hypothetical protein